MAKKQSAKTCANCIHKHTCGITGEDVVNNETDNILQVRPRWCPMKETAPKQTASWGNYDAYLGGYRCSCCKLSHRTCTKYCPHCGAKMEI